MRGLIAALAGLALSGAVDLAHAHAVGTADASSSTPEPWVPLSLSLAALLYATGFHKLRRRSGEDRN